MPRSTSQLALLPAVALLGAVVLLLSGCSGSTGLPVATTTEAATIDNCGVDVAVTAPPSRVITIKSTSTEMLLALGLGDRIVGTAFQDGPVPEQWAEAAGSLPVLSDKVPSQEVVLNENPDFIYAGWESNFSADGAGTRHDLAALGIRTFVSPAACKESAYQPKLLTFDDIDREIGEIATLFGVDDSAVLASQHETLAGIRKDTRGLSALWFSSGSTIPYVGAGIGAPQLILDTIGLRNIAADVKDTWASYNWESVIAEDPDVIVLVDSSWSTKEKKIAVLESNPATVQLSAVKNHRYLVVPFAASEAGVRTVRADLLDDGALAALPDAPNVIFMAAMKFGATGQEALTWAMNTYLPGRVAERYRNSRIVAFSSGNIYPLSPLTAGGPTEDDPTGPVGEYAQSVLGRERIFEYFSIRNGTPTTLLRLNYAVEMRYGVLVDLATTIMEGEPIDVAMGQVNVIWQGDANEATLRSLHLCSSPATVLNLTGPETVSVRRLAQRLGARMGKEPTFTGEEQPTALLNDASRSHGLFGYPSVALATIIERVADWVVGGGETHGKPTGFQVRSGIF